MNPEQDPMPDCVASQSVQHTIRIHAKPSVVWNTLVDVAKIAQWMGGAQVEATWKPGNAIAARFFWRNALRDIRDMAESAST